MNSKILTKRLMKQTSSAHWLKKPPVTILIAILGLALVLVVMTMNIIKYETHLANGDVVLLKLAPVDPRGFMQGDYMALSYAIERDIFDALENQVKEGLHGAISFDGYVIVVLNKNNVGQFVRLAKSNEPDALAANEMALHYRIRNGSLKLATNAFFFQEGHSEAFEASEYGRFRVNDQGEPLLIDMVDEKFQVIEAENTEVKEMQVDKAS